MYVIKLSELHCIGNACVTQHKDPKDKLLRALLEASMLLFDNPHQLRYRFLIGRVSGSDIWVSEQLTDLHLQFPYKVEFNSLNMHFGL